MHKSSVRFRFGSAKENRRFGSVRQKIPGSVVSYSLTLKIFTESYKYYILCLQFHVTSLHSKAMYMHFGD